MKSLAEIYRLMMNHENPVTRAVYRRIFIARTLGKAK